MSRVTILWIAIAIFILLSGCEQGENFQSEEWVEETINSVISSGIYDIGANSGESIYLILRLIPDGYYITDEDESHNEAIALFKALFRNPHMKQVELIWVDNDFPEDVNELLYIKMAQETFEELNWDAVNASELKSIADRYVLN